jgi:radical SAM superfamily enzyme YgiQ (UPF0313 family)
MHYEGNMIRPPSEAQSILLQVTVGCSHNKCKFCGAYKGQRFKIKSDDIWAADIEYAGRHFRHCRRLFICDGDALIIPFPRLLALLRRIQRELPWIERVGLYANAKSIDLKTDDQLRQLHEHGLGIAYMGLESGDDPTLKRIGKGADSDKMIAMGQKIQRAGIALSITVLLGLAGKTDSLRHARATGRALSAIDPAYVGALSLMLIPGTPMHDDYQAGRFEMISPSAMLAELRAMIAATDLTDGLFHANHASNYLPLRARLPHDKMRTLDLIDRALAGQIDLKPEWMRAL